MRSMFSLNRRVQGQSLQRNTVAAICVVGTLLLSGPAEAGRIVLTSVAGFPNGRTSNDVPANAIDLNTSTYTWTTESFNSAIPSYLAVGFFTTTAINRVRLWKNRDGGGGENIKNLTIEYSTDAGPLPSRTWTAVSGLSNGYFGSELLVATAVNTNGTVVGDTHDSSTTDGWASLTFNAVDATGIRVAFRNPNIATFNHYRVGEIEVWWHDCVQASDCDDHNACTGAEACNSLTGTCVNGTPITCDDGNLCNGLETCSPSTGLCDAGTAVNCDDGDACTGIETCNPTNGACVPGTAVTCGDGNACNGTEVCNPSTGACDPGTSVTCNDGDDCNGVETCDAGSGSCSPGAPVVCDDGAPCNGLETCNPVGGECIAGAPVVCDDHNDCNGLEACNAANGTCTPGTPVPCSDGNPCNGLETCNPIGGTCTAGSPVDCDDHDACNGLETCNTTDGSCTPGTPILCGDGDVCNGGEVCNPADGTCSVGSPVNCDDGDPCTGLETCNPSDGSCSSASTNICDDADACNGAEVCNPSNGACTPGTPVACDDGNACNGVETCRSSDGACLGGTSVTCDDDNICNGLEACRTSDGACVPGTPLTCDDHLPCTQDGCNPDTGCQYDAAPKAPCNQLFGKAAVLVQDAEGEEKDKVQFKWSKGAADLADFGDPTIGTDYTLCVYDVNGIVAALSVPASAMCGADACWTAVGKTVNGYKYKDKRKPPVNDGVSKVEVKAGPAGKAKVNLSASGANVPSLDLSGGLTYPVAAQLVTDDADCWEATFSVMDEKKNEEDVFKAAR